jgi:hypothetical protein
MCCVWKIRQEKLGIDDFGNPVDPLIYPTINTDEANQHQEIVIEPTTEGPARPQDEDETPPRKVESPPSRKRWFVWFGRN